MIKIDNIGECSIDRKFIKELLRMPGFSLMMIN